MVRAGHAGTGKGAARRRPRNRRKRRNPELKPYVYIRAFRTPENRPLLACWATLYRQKVEAEAIDTPAWQDQKPGTSLLWNGFPAEREPEPLPVRFRVGVPEVEVADLMGNRRKVRTDNGFLTLRLDDYPQFVLGAAPELLREAEHFSLNLFPAEFQPNDKWKTLIQAVLPGGKEASGPQIRLRQAEPFRDLEGRRTLSGPPPAHQPRQ